METVRRHIKFDYYRVVSRKTDDGPYTRDTLFDLRRWIEKALRLSLEGRTFDYKQERARLEKAGFDMNLQYWYLHFLRMRDTLLPSIAKVTENVEPFELDDDEYLSEEATALYDEDYHILMLQRNRYSLGPSGLEEYLNLVWADDKETIYLRPIQSRDAVERIKAADSYRRIAVRFADLEKVGNIETRSPIKWLVDAAKRYGAVNAEIIFTMGLKRQASLDPRTVVDSVEDLMKNEGLASKAEVGIKNDDTKVEIVDLFEDRAQNGAFIDVPRRSTLSHEAIFEVMVDIYKDNRMRILRYLEE